METQPKKTFNILIVDDVPQNIQVVANILQKEHYHMAFAQNGKTALELVRRAPFDLILLDIMMPEMDGMMVCEELKHDPLTRDIPVIFLTARTEVEDILRGFEKGAVDYVSKPFNSAELLARVKSHLDLRAAREELKKANQELHILNATKDKFFSIIAHDLRNPIQSLILASDLLRTHFDSFHEEKKKDYIERFYSNATLIAGLLENLLEWSNSQQGRLTVIPHRLYLARLTEESLQLAARQAEGKNIVITTSVPGDLEAWGDQKMAQTILRNLIANAVKFTPRGGTIEINGRDAGDYAEISIADSGCGIDEETLAQLFRIDCHKTTPGADGEKGTGLGLILCKEFLEKNGGAITVSSRPGVGSTFVFTLPKKKNGVE